MNQEKPLSRDWKSINTEYESSGKSQLLFCQENGINIATFQYHRRRLIETNPQARPSQRIFEVNPQIPTTNVAGNSSQMEWKLSISIMGVVAFEVRLG